MITLYTTGCPKCKILERKLNEKNIEYNIIEGAEAIHSIKSFGLSEAPVMTIDDNSILTFGDAVRWVNNK